MRGMASGYRSPATLIAAAASSMALRSPVVSSTWGLESLTPCLQNPSSVSPGSVGLPSGCFLIIRAR
jgi:hypothetical protein